MNITRLHVLYKGFSDENDKQLVEAADLENYPVNKYVIILMDEMHIKEDVVYDKHMGMQFCVSIINLILFICIYRCHHWFYQPR